MAFQPAQHYIQRHTKQQENKSCHFAAIETWQQNKDYLSQAYCTLDENSEAITSSMPNHYVSSCKGERTGHTHGLDCAFLLQLNQAIFFSEPRSKDEDKTKPNEAKNLYGTELGKQIEI
jgi:hypothetical protein